MDLRIGHGGGIPRAYLIQLNSQAVMEVKSKERTKTKKKSLK
jgi:hypothetical protein